MSEHDNLLSKNISSGGTFEDSTIVEGGPTIVESLPTSPEAQVKQSEGDIRASKKGKSGKKATAGDNKDGGDGMMLRYTTLAPPNSFEIHASDSIF